MKIYADYDEEPEDLFLPLPENLYRELYDLEMADFRDDFPFYRSVLGINADLLELGCGSGRLTRLLAAAGHTVTGIDLSTPMLQEAIARSGGNSRHLRMDMRQIAFNKKFNGIIIPYNTLNLLADNSDVARCLRGCRAHLKTGGHLLLQLYIAGENLRADSSTTTFQFQLFDRPQGGKVIKETLRTCHAVTNTIMMTERYKIRPMNPAQANANYSHAMLLNANDRATWLRLILDAGFSIEFLATQYETSGKSSPSLLLVKCKRQR